MENFMLDNLIDINKKILAVILKRINENPDYSSDEKCVNDYNNIYSCFKLIIQMEFFKSLGVKLDSFHENYFWYYFNKNIPEFYDPKKQESYIA